MRPTLMLRGMVAAAGLALCLATPAWSAESSTGEEFGVWQDGTFIPLYNIGTGGNESLSVLDLYNLHGLQTIDGSGLGGQLLATADGNGGSGGQVGGGDGFGVPEPGTLALLGAGIMSLGLLRRRTD